ncbi:MAG TPA: hypothetical protein PLP95_12465, partial [Microthrixaceae bacterium]|nr:hypothetical protein [Microthrixaceae bacterium]
MAQRRAAQLGGLIRSGQSATAIGLAFNGLAAYVFLAAAGRSLGPAEFAPLSVLWTMLFLVATGLFQPFEQELARAVSANRSLGLGYSEVVRRNAVVAAALVACVILIGAIAAGPIAEGFFRGERSFVIALVVGIAGIGFMFFVRGLLAGSGRFYGFAVLFVADGLTKSLPAVIFWLAGGRNPSVFVAVLVAGGFVGGAAPLTRGGVRATDPGPIPQWG